MHWHSHEAYIPFIFSLLHLPSLVIFLDNEFHDPQARILLKLLLLVHIFYILLQGACSIAFFVCFKLSLQCCARLLLLLTQSWSFGADYCLRWQNALLSSPSCVTHSEGCIEVTEINCHCVSFICLFSSVQECQHFTIWGISAGTPGRLTALENCNCLWSRHL